MYFVHVDDVEDTVGFDKCEILTIFLYFFSQYHREETLIKNSQFSKWNNGNLIYSESDQAFDGSIVNRTCHSKYQHLTFICIEHFLAEYCWKFL